MGSWAWTNGHLCRALTIIPTSGIAAPGTPWSNIPYVRLLEEAWEWCSSRVRPENTPSRWTCVQFECGLARLLRGRRWRTTAEYARAERQTCRHLMFCGCKPCWQHDHTPITHWNIDLRTECAYYLVLEAPEYGGVFQFWKRVHLRAPAWGGEVFSKKNSSGQTYNISSFPEKKSSSCVESK